MKENYFSNKVKKRSTEELLDICSSDSGRADKFILAALWELEKSDALLPELHERLIYLEANQKKELSRAEYNSHFVPPDLPRNLKITAYLLYFVFVLDIVKFLISGSLSLVGLNFLVVPVSVITLLVAIFVHKGNYWARVAFYIVFFCCTLIFIISVQRADVIGVFQQISISIALFFILTKESRRWYKSKIASINDKA